MYVNSTSVVVKYNHTHLFTMCYYVYSPTSEFKTCPNMRAVQSHIALH